LADGPDGMPPTLAAGFRRLSVRQKELSIIAKAYFKDFCEGDWESYYQQAVDRQRQEFAAQEDETHPVTDDGDAQDAMAQA
jgi:hypothetical protein